MALWVAGSKSGPLSLSLSSTGACGAQGRCRKISQRSAHNGVSSTSLYHARGRRVTGAYLTPLPVRCNLLFDAASELSVSTISFLFLAISCFAMIFIFYYMKWVLYLPLILGSFEGMIESSVFFPQFRLNELIGDHADYARGGLQRFMDFNPSFDLVFD